MALDKQKFVLGLIGGIGSGKSLVAAELQKKGGYLISGDRLGHEALRQPDIKNRVMRRWGEQILDAGGEVNRKRLGKLVFADEAERRALEALVFPWIEKRIEEEIAQARENPEVKFIVLDAAIMLEAGWNRFCDRIVFVDAPRQVRLERLAIQRGWTEAEVAAREKAQMALTEKRNRADAVVDNSGSPAEVSRQVEQLLTQWGIAASGAA